LFDGAVHDTTDCVLTAPVAETPVGAFGTPTGITDDDAVEAEPVPDALVAVTVNVYETPFVRPVTVQVVVAVAHWNEPGDEVTLYPVIDAPPLLAGAVHDTTDWPFAPSVADTEVGEPGGAAGTAAAEAADATEVPIAFVAVTVNVYEVPLVRPDTVHEVDDADDVVQVFDPGEDVTVYPVIVDIPSSAGAVHETTDWALPFEVADTPIGASGADAAAATVISEDAEPAPLLPFTLTACTW
jgi:hypothetical protein